MKSNRQSVRVDIRDQSHFKVMEMKGRSKKKSNKREIHQGKDRRENG